MKVPPKDVEDDKSDSAPWFSGQHVSTALGGLMGGINTGLNRINTFVSHVGHTPYAPSQAYLQLRPRY